jgi:predicted transcriptional regulator
MPCISADGKPTATGMTTLKSLRDGALSPEEVAGKTGQPLFRIRSGLRELKTAELVEEEGEKYKLSKNGEKAIQ